MKTGRLLIILSLLLIVAAALAAAGQEEEQPQSDGLRGTTTKEQQVRNLQLQPNFNPSRVKVLVQYKTPQGEQVAKQKASSVGYESERFSVVAMEVDPRKIPELENDINIESVSLNQDMRLILPIELRGQTFTNGVSSQSIPTISKPGKSKPAKTISTTTKKRHRNLAELVPWGIEAIQASGVQPGSDTNDITVCVVDTGYDTTHEDLPGPPTVNGTDNELYEDPESGFVGHEWDVDVDWHGTHVAGTIVAKGGNNQGVVGVVSNANPNGIKLHIGKGLDNNGTGSSDGVMAAVDDCINAGARIISMSLAGGDPNSVIESVFANAYDNGVLVVAAASNDNSDAKEYPASYPSVMSVAALEDVDPGSLPYYKRAWFSNYNDQVEIAAPGYKVTSTVPGDDYRTWSGTSMATPHVAGAAAILWSYDQSCTAKQIRKILLATSMPLADGGCDDYFGRGMVQVQNAVDMLVSGGCDAAEGLGILDDSDGYNNDNVCENIPYFERCTHGQDTLKLVLLTDGSPSETTWEVTNMNNGGLVASGGGYSSSNTEYTETIDLCIGRPYEFKIKDSAGNGLSGTGGYMLELESSLLGNKVIKPFGGFTGASEKTGDIFPTICEAGKEIVLIDFYTDEWPEETSWELINTAAPDEVLLGDVYVEDDDDVEEFFYSSCLDFDTEYKFEVLDQYGDGICCSYGRGRFTLQYGNVIVVKDGGSFEDVDSYTFTIPDEVTDECTVNSDCPGSLEILACPSVCDEGKCVVSDDCDCSSITCDDEDDVTTCDFDCGTPDKELFTTSMDNNLQAGNMWRVKARNGIQIQQFEINAGAKGATLVAKVFVKVGDYRGYESKPEDWTLVQDIEFVSEGDDKLSLLPLLPNPIVVDAGEMVSFYLTLITPDLKYTNGNSEENIFASNEDLEFYEGVGKVFPFAGTFRPRIFNGIIRYTVLSDEVNDGNGSTDAPGGCSIDSECSQPEFPFVCPSFSCNLATNVCEQTCNCDLVPDSGETGVTCPSDFSASSELVTETSSNNEQAGNMFKITVQKQDIQILQFDVHADNGGSEFNAKVFIKEGGYSGYDKDPSAWTLLQEAFDVTSLGEGNLTPLPPLSSGSIVLQAGTTHSFYVTLTTPTIKYTNGVAEGARHSSSNNDIFFFEGLGKQYAFGDSFSPRVWNGKISYLVL